MFFQEPLAARRQHDILSALTAHLIEGRAFYAQWRGGGHANEDDRLGACHRAIPDRRSNSTMNVNWSTAVAARNESSSCCASKSIRRTAQVCGVIVGP